MRQRSCPLGSSSSLRCCCIATLVGAPGRTSRCNSAVCGRYTRDGGEIAHARTQQVRAATTRIRSRAEGENTCGASCTYIVVVVLHVQQKLGGRHGHVLAVGALRHRGVLCRVHAVIVAGLRATVGQRLGAGVGRAAHRGEVRRRAVRRGGGGVGRFAAAPVAEAAGPCAAAAAVERGRRVCCVWRVVGRGWRCVAAQRAEVLVFNGRAHPLPLLRLRHARQLILLRGAAVEVQLRQG